MDRHFCRTLAKKAMENKPAKDQPTRELTMKTVGFVVLVHSFFCGIQPPQEKVETDDFIVRTAVYSGSPKTAIPRKGKWAKFEVLLVPKELAEAYSRNPEKTLMLLLSIVEGANPRDAALAAGFAISLARSPVAGAIAVSGARGVKDANFDRLFADTGMSFRTILIDQVRTLMAQTNSKKKKKG